jgi:hypothetical protein
MAIDVNAIHASCDPLMPTIGWEEMEDNWRSGHNSSISKLKIDLGL